MSEASINQDDLPITWALTNLGSVVNYGSTNKAEPNEIADGDWVLELEDIERDSSRLLQKMTFLQRQSKSTKNHFQAGDVLYGKLRPYLNKVLIAGEPGYCTTEILPLNAGTHVDNRYLFYWLKHPVFLKYVEAESHGMNMPRLGTETGKAAPFVLAPRNEQTRIAIQLDTLLARVQACNDRFDAIPALLKRFRRLVVDSAVSGRLSRDWRTGQNSGESGTDLVKRDAIAKAQLIAQRPELAKKKSSTHANVDVEYLFATPDGWSMSTWGRISEWITYGFTKPMPSTENGIRLLTAKDVHPFDVRIGKSGYTSLTAYDGLSEKDRPRTGDLLITKDGTIGRAALVDSDEKFCINQSVAVCWLRSTSMNKAFLELVANASYSQRFVLDKAKGMAIQHLSIVDFAQCPVPVPPLAEQTEIVRRVESLFALADRIEVRCTAARAQAQRLTPLVLAKAFRGELVPQDPNDEPARELLARIASSNSAVAGKNRRKVPVAPKERAQAAINL